MDTNAYSKQNITKGSDHIITVLNSTCISVLRSSEPFSPFLQNVVQYTDCRQMINCYTPLVWNFDSAPVNSFGALSTLIFLLPGTFVMLVNCVDDKDNPGVLSVSESPTSQRHWLPVYQLPLFTRSGLFILGFSSSFSSIWIMSPWISWYPPVNSRFLLIFPLLSCECVDGSSWFADFMLVLWLHGCFLVFLAICSTWVTIGHQICVLLRLLLQCSISHVG